MKGVEGVWLCRLAGRGQQMDEPQAACRLGRITGFKIEYAETNRRRAHLPDPIKVTKGENVEGAKHRVTHWCVHALSDAPTQSRPWLKKIILINILKKQQHLLELC